MTNAVTPIADAYYDNIPLVVITGQVGTGDMRGDLPIKQRGFQEVDTVDLMKPITKAAFLVKDIARSARCDGSRPSSWRATAARARWWWTCR